MNDVKVHTVLDSYVRPLDPLPRNNRKIGRGSIIWGLGVLNTVLAIERLCFVVTYGSIHS